MRRVLTIALFILPIAAQAQRLSSLNLAPGATAIPPLGAFVEGACEWQASGATGFTASVGYSLRTAGLGNATEGIGDYYSRLSTADLRVGLSVHDFHATHIYPHFDLGATLSVRIAQTDVKYRHADIDPLFPMLYIGAGLRQAVSDRNAIGVGGRIEVSPTSHNSAANTAIAMLEWSTAL